MFSTTEATKMSWSLSQSKNMYKNVFLIGAI